MVISMQTLLQREKKRHRLCFLMLLLFFISMPVADLSAQQNGEAGSATVDSSQQTGVDVPGESEQGENEQANDKKKDERPRELGVLILIVWILAGTGIGILIFTSLFGHSVRSMIRRPYPSQTHPDQQNSAKPAPDNSDDSEQVEEEPPKA
ncbi:hypothetical protein Enr17x_39610 [Gimesia fumaroli]|uniref:Uncharacterized protein n=2 Tax=Gimesia fumaroli TaxID=2527976 RepID=A0A518IFN4_9PLAN|nr:hypothetical protein Enr17x_39610 [Gimesia fumaroli]